MSGNLVGFGGGGWPTPDGLEQRVGAVEQELAELRQFIATHPNLQPHAVISAAAGPLATAGGLNEKVATLDAEIVREDSNDSECCSDDSEHDKDDATLQALDRRQVDRLLDGDNTYPVAKSAWDLVLFIGAGGLFSTPASLVFAAGALLNAALQLVFVGIILSPTFFAISYDTFEFGAKRWRLHYGHSGAHVDPVSGSSLVSRVCSHDSALQLSTQQGSMYANADKYLDVRFFNVEIGVALAICSVVLLALRVSQELRQTCRFCQGVACLPRAQRTTLELRNGRLALASISPGRRVIAWLVVMVRLAIAVAIFLAGSRWLVKTVNLEALLLHTMSLAFFLTTDEIIYFVFSTRRLNTLLGKMEHLRCDESFALGSSRTLRHGLNVVIFLLLCKTLFIDLKNVHDSLKKIKDHLCGGDQNFIFDKDPAGTLYYAVTPPYMAHHGHRMGHQHKRAEVAQVHNDMEEMNEEAIDCLIAGEPVPDSLRFGVLMVPTEDMHEKVTANVVSVARALGGCIDSPHNFSKMASLIGAGNRTNCTAAQSLCNFGHSVALRLYCPETCGCNSPDSGLVQRRLRDGCPAACRETTEYQQYRRQASCEDWSASALRSSQDWKDLLNGFRLLLEEEFSSLDSISSAEDWSDESIAQLSCPIVSEWLSNKTKFKINTLTDVCRRGLVGFCPETCWCANSSAQDTWKQDFFYEANDMFERECPVSCKAGQQ